MQQLQLFHTPAPSNPPHRRRRRRRSARRTAVTVLALGIATAGMIAGSYAAWTASTNNPTNSVAAGTLTMTNNKSATAVFTASNIKPGDTGSNTVTIGNSGSIPMTVKLTQDTLSSSGIEASLRFSVHDDTRNYCYWPTTAAGACGSRGAWDATGTLTNFTIPATDGSGQWPASQTHTFTISWELISASPNSDQGKTGSFRLVWDGAQ